VNVTADLFLESIEKALPYATILLSGVYWSVVET